MYIILDSRNSGLNGDYKLLHCDKVDQSQVWLWRTGRHQSSQGLKVSSLYTASSPPSPHLNSLSSLFPPPEPTHPPLHSLYTPARPRQGLKIRPFPEIKTALTTQFETLVLQACLHIKTYHKVAQGPPTPQSNLLPPRYALLLPHPILKFNQHRKFSPFLIGTFKPTNSFTNLPHHQSWELIKADYHKIIVMYLACKKTRCANK